jgi:hypothetical protein
MVLMDPKDIYWAADVAIAKARVMLAMTDLMFAVHRDAVPADLRANMDDLRSILWKDSPAWENDFERRKESMDDLTPIISRLRPILSDLEYWSMLRQFALPLLPELATRQSPD